MAYTLACQDSGIDCPYVARGETEEEMLQDATKHVKAVHGYTDEQLNDPKFLEEVKKLTKKTQMFHLEGWFNRDGLDLMQQLGAVHAPGRVQSK